MMLLYLLAATIGALVGGTVVLLINRYNAEVHFMLKDGKNPFHRDCLYENVTVTIGSNHIVCLDATDNTIEHRDIVDYMMKHGGRRL